MKLISDKDWNLFLRDTVAVSYHRTEVGRGKILKCLRETNEVIVEGVNLKPVAVPDPDDADNPMAKKIWIETEHPVHYSACRLIDPDDNMPCSIRRVYLADGKQVRQSKRSRAVIEREPHVPNTTYEERISRPTAPHTTAKEDVVEVTYVPPELPEIGGAQQEQR